MTHHPSCKPNDKSLVWKCGQCGLEEPAETIINSVEKAIKLAVDYGSIDGAHHKDWVIDQIVRALAGDRYEDIVRDAKAGEDGPDTYEWNCGIAP
jgi:hypothetical protein